MANLIEIIMKKGVEKISCRSFVIIINSICNDLTRKDFPGVWKYLDTVLLIHINEITQDIRTSFIVV